MNGHKPFLNFIIQPELEKFNRFFGKLQKKKLKNKTLSVNIL